MSRKWPKRSLAELLDVQNGFAFSSKQFHPTNGMPLIRIRDLKNGFETETRFTGQYESRYVVDRGDLLIGMDGEFGCFEWLGGPGLLNQRVCKLREFSSDLTPRFLYYGIKSYLKAIEEVTGYATVKHLSSRQILDIEFPVPPLSEQQRIVGILDEAFEGINTAKTNAEKNLWNARAIFERHLDSIFSDGSSGSSFLSDLASFRNGINYTQDSKGESVKIVGVRNFRANFDAPLEGLDSVRISGKLRDADLLRPGDILAVRSNGNIDLIGRCMLVGKILEKISHSGFTIRIRLERHDISPRYLCYFLRSASTRTRLTDGGTGTNIKSLSQETLAALPIPVVSLTQQKKIVDTLDRVSNESGRLESIYKQKLAALDALKKSLLHEAFSGNL